MIRGLHAVLSAVWYSGTISFDWKKDRQECNNYRGITLFSVQGKVLSHLPLKQQRPEQSWLTPGKSTPDRILVPHALVECRREFRQGMVATYVDLKKTFHSEH